MPKNPFSKKKKKQVHANRRRSGFILPQQRDFIPIMLGAASAAILAHAALFMYAPNFSFLTPTQRTVEAQVTDEIITISIKEPPKREYEKAKEDPQEITETKDVEEAIREPETREIDVLDYKVEELTLAPGVTDLAFPEPVQGADDPGAVTEMPVSELDASTLADVSVPEEALQVAEPTPVNASDVIVVAEAQMQDVEGANSLRNTELQASAEAGEGQLPADTRSLAELMGVSNPGSESGVARLGADLLFNFDQCRMTSAARFSMLQLAALIQKNPETDFVIEGHTDSFGGADYNALLSLQRAAAVCEWLQKNKVPVERVHIRACGNTAPLVSTKGDQKAQSLNRRVEIHMRRKGEALPDGCFPATYPVDLDTPTRTQLTNGVRVPEVYTPSGTSVATDGADKPATTAPTDTKPAPAKPAKPAATTPQKPAKNTKPANNKGGKGKTAPAKGGKSNTKKGR